MPSRCTLLPRVAHLHALLDTTLPLASWMCFWNPSLLSRRENQVPREVSTVKSTSTYKLNTKCYSWVCYGVSSKLEHDFQGMMKSVKHLYFDFSSIQFHVYRIVSRVRQSERTRRRWTAKKKGCRRRLWEFRRSTTSLDTVYVALVVSVILQLWLWRVVVVVFVGENFRVSGRRKIWTVLKIRF